MIQAEPKEVIRKAIKRRAIMTERSLLKRKLRELESASTYGEIVSLIKHYEMLVRQVKKVASHRAISKAWKNDRRYQFFELLHEMCKMKSWSPKLYIEAQFDRYTKLGHTKYTYPQVNQMCSEESIRYFINYLANVRRTYEKDINGRKKEKGRETRSLYQEILDAVVDSTKTVSEYMDSIDMTDEQGKAVAIYQKWQNLSAYYLYSVEWFHPVLQEALDGLFASRMRDKFEMIQKSNEMQGIIAKVVSAAEQHYNLPKNMAM